MNSAMVWGAEPLGKNEVSVRLWGGDPRVDSSCPASWESEATMSTNTSLSHCVMPRVTSGLFSGEVVVGTAPDLGPEL